MTPTKDQQAKEYAEKRLQGRYPAHIIATTHTFKKSPMFDTYDIQQAYLDGYTACEQSMWRSVEEELPSNDDKVFVIIRGAYVCGWYDHKYESWEIFGMGSYNRKDASYWMPIPPIHDTNTEKK